MSFYKGLSGTLAPGLKGHSKQVISGSQKKESVGVLHTCIPEWRDLVSQRPPRRGEAGGLNALSPCSLLLFSFERSQRAEGWEVR